MTPPLASALRTAAADAPTYDVLDGAIMLGRRRRRRSVLGSTAAIAAVLALVLFAVVPLIGARPAPIGTPPPVPTLPDRIGPPGPFARAVGGSPPGPAGVLFAAQGSDHLVTVGLAEDTYRVLAAAATDPGRTALLSPDGGRIAYGIANSLAIVDLRSGQRRLIPTPGSSADAASPAAWLPDGTGLIVLTISYAKDPTVQGIMKQLGTVDLGTGEYQEFAAATWPIAPTGFAVAVSPDGARIAYQFSDFITVYQRANGNKTVFTVPEANSLLAGKGAWTPDGRSLAVVARDTDFYQDQVWQVRLLDPVTGEERDPLDRPRLEGMSLIRLLGWDGATGRPVVVGYRANAAPLDLVHGAAIMPTSLVHRVGVYELSGTAARTLVEPIDGVAGIDVADVVLAGGQTRAGHPPNALSPLAIAAIGLAVVLLLGPAAGWWWRRRSPRSPVPVGGGRPVETDRPPVEPKAGLEAD